MPKIIDSAVSYDYPMATYGDKLQSFKRWRQ